MILKSLKYTRYVGEPREWNIVGKENGYASFENINLLVGKNASGKSRTLNVIREIAGLLSGRTTLSEVFSPSQSFELVFAAKGISYKYTLRFKDRRIIEETLVVDGKMFIDRTKGVFLDLKGSDISNNIFDSINESSLLICIHDSEGNLYYEILVEWGKSLKNYLFANQFEKNKQVKDYTRIDGGDPGIEGSEILIYTFYKGRELFADKFVSEIVSGMQELGNSVTNIDIIEKKGYYGLCVEEEGKYLVSQRDMSQGMFRALALLIMLTYARLSNLSLCMLIDDMGEGLDFDTSKRMMDIVIKRINNSNLQFFMTTNDRYVMNQIPLKYWNVIDRENSKKSVFYDYANSKEIFDDFEYTGLNNFDFLSTDFYKTGFGQIDEEND
ncbi:ATP/GTP-binding protein [Dysgonomonas sp. BGC7]|uniref:AAA family ATPase n=1 Tax=Dysgonomonas sp. BGC7 TaxID=1658008 RepID=UPI00068219E2|nr:AAA family ATPase [Dysgonomonas sp. BGC7]MBD8388518.1 ATP-binding protein [Dysgonomonas sp. BGC7]